MLAPFPVSLTTTCAPCRGRVVWAITDAHGKRIPLDPDPDESGNQAVRRDEHGTVRTRQLRDGEEPEVWERRMVPHFPTCQRRQDEASGRRSAGQAARPAAPVVPSGVADMAAYRRRRAGRRR